MQKIPTLFVRDPLIRSRVTPAVTPGCEWVTDGEGAATRKFDGSACMVRAGALFKRYDCKKGKTPPPFFEPCQEPDPLTGHWPGWVPVGSAPEDQWAREAWDASPGLQDGTYELLGPKLQGNPERLAQHTLVRHGADKVDAPRTFAELGQYFGRVIMEGVVWHHPDGRMCKIKARDFGHDWPPGSRGER